MLFLWCISFYRYEPPPPRSSIKSRYGPDNHGHITFIYVRVQEGTDLGPVSQIFVPCRVGSVGSVSASRTVGRDFAPRPGHIKDHHKNGTNCLPA